MLLLALRCALLSDAPGRTPGIERAEAERAHQRDSLIARSRLPGAGVMGKAIAVTDSAAAQAEAPRRADEMIDSFAIRHRAAQPFTHPV